jgi:hypothetical protein
MPVIPIPLISQSKEAARTDLKYLRLPNNSYNSYNSNNKYLCNANAQLNLNFNANIKSVCFKRYILLCWQSLASLTYFVIIVFQQQQTSPPMIPGSPGSSNGRKMSSKADRRAEHNAIERARRESLNTKFQELAHSLPNLQNDRRPSKGTIIERTLDFGKFFP